MIAAGPEASGMAAVEWFTRRISVRSLEIDLTDIRPPVHIWHGDADTNVPVAMAHTLAARIPDSRLTSSMKGHLVVPKHWDEILAALLNAA